MYAWLVVEETQAKLLPAALGRAWRQGAALSAVLELPERRRTQALVFAWADPQAAEATPRRPPRWPDLLSEWSEIYGEPLFQGDALPVLGEETSALGADALIVHVAPGLAGATIAWYERGALISYEHVGAATVSWTEPEGLGRPLEGGRRGSLAAGARKLASAEDDLILDRIEKSARATGEALLERALHRFLAHDPPPFEDLAGLLARATTQRIEAG
ncbi:MAG TPA: hypothetical protein VK698_10810 [Kofleriaceae bacterium]|nr:hypothetical protein [Kofleriaceae bacterium]